MVFDLFLFFLNLPEIHLTIDATHRAEVNFREIKKNGKQIYNHFCSSFLALHISLVSLLQSFEVLVSLP